MSHFWFVSNVGISDPDAPGPVGTPLAAPEPEPEPVPDCRLCVAVVNVPPTVLQSSTHPKHCYTPVPHHANLRPRRPRQLPHHRNVHYLTGPLQLHCLKRAKQEQLNTSKGLGAADDGLKLGKLVCLKPPQTPPALLLPLLLFFTPPNRKHLHCFPLASGRTCSF